MWLKKQDIMYAYVKYKENLLPYSKIYLVF